MVTFLFSFVMFASTLPQTLPHHPYGLTRHAKLTRQIGAGSLRLCKDDGDDGSGKLHPHKPIFMAVALVNIHCAAATISLSGVANGG